MQAHHSTQSLYVPIDVGKNVHAFGAYVGPHLAPLIPSQAVVTRRCGYEQFTNWLAEHIASQRYAPIIVGLEPTGVYHEPWAYALARDVGTQVSLQMVNPFRTRQKRRQLQNRAEQKTDPIDVEALAHCLRDGLGRPFHLPNPELLALEIWCRDHYRLRHDQVQLTNRLRSELDRLWPGALVDVQAFTTAHPQLAVPEPLVRTQPLRRKLVQGILGIDPDPYTWQGMSRDQIRTTLRGAGLRCGPKTAHKVWHIAHRAVLPPRAMAALLAAQVRADFQRYLHYQTQLAHLRAQAEALLRRSSGVVVATVPGISDFLAARYVSVVADVHRFEHADQVWALVGFDIVQDDSGDRRRRGAITKRGQPYGRDVLYQLGFFTSRACSVIRRAKLRALRRGKSHIEAVIHAAHKANRMCFHLYKHGIPFDPAHAR